VSHSFAAGAEGEYLEAIQFFEEKSPGLGEALIKEFERIISLAIKRPEAWKMVHPVGIRRIALARFPYTVFYRVLPDQQIQITAFAHHRRRPGYWLARIDP
jgi:toxin ParE1/3/4